VNAANVAENKSLLEKKFLTFVVDKDSYGLEIDYVKQIIGVQEIAVVPNQPKFIKGVINLRGSIIPIMDMRLKFGKLEKEYDDRTCIIVLEVNGDDIGIIVDSVSDVIDISEERISKTPEFEDQIDNRYIRGIARLKNQLIIMLDCLELLKFIDMTMIEKSK
jgi:purine-binding chemotaxis protein CheW